MQAKIQEIKEISSDITILYVEDDALLRQTIQSYLLRLFDDVRVCVDGQDGLEQYKQRAADIVLTDISMPRLNGIEMIRAIKQINPDQHSIIFSAYTENSYFLDSITLGVSSYIIKPIEYGQVNDVLFDMISRIRMEKDAKIYHEHLEDLVEQNIKAYKALQEKRVEDYEAILLALSNVVERRDSYTAGHSQRVAQYSKMLAHELGFSEADCDLVYRAGILHDIGKIATPDTILLKPSSLDALEYKLIKEHVSVGVEMLGRIPHFEPLSKIIISHHERYDGKGYPQGLSGDAITPLARVMIVADAFDAMTTSRIYRHKKSKEEALRELEACSGTQFHPEVVVAALKAFKNIKIQKNISQLPTNPLEEERFAYFYRDRISHLYNQDYLNIALAKNLYKPFFHTLRTISLHNFKDYNDTFGWEEGDKFLLRIAQALRSLHPNMLGFRIHGDDFVFLSAQEFIKDEKVYEALKLEQKYGVTCSIEDINLDTNPIASVRILDELRRKVK